MRKWKRVETTAGPRFRSSFAEHEAALLRNLVSSLLEMLEQRETTAPRDELEQITGIRTGNAQPPEDATLNRLLPDFYRPARNHPAGSAAAESLNSALRSLHEPTIIDAKRTAAQRLLDTVPAGGGRLELSEDDANAWIAAVNDVRLALGTMLGVGPGGPEELPEHHPMAGHLDVYHWLTMLQEYLVLALMGRR
ncbi:DUF2017 domain-containing protein [Mycobacterium sp. MYCO198283]|uniref:oxidative stress transcriptional regulator AosR n=1 Tax=Mycobacterium sp. MYCO198283 TaxID=2883505 RepID=UPI001E3E561B|nr:DUF2017 domain-containing protein [Mycobacterium sp. MYCO198283]MCG5434456.1 DUF2017 domain-containing protein [Mycobacterium sp. MYCO198283]